MATKTTDGPATTEDRPLHLTDYQVCRCELADLRDDIRRIDEMIDCLRTKVLGDESMAGNFIRGDVVDGALKMISGRLRMALNDY